MRGIGRMELGLEGQVVILSGGSRGIGYACARLFAEEGARLAIAARNQEHLECAAERIRRETSCEVLAVQADMTRCEDVKRFVQATRTQYGKIDVLVNVAGAAPGG